MGRKVHPIGFRLKSIRDWNTRWYAEGERYSELLHEDFAVRRMINDELPRAGISRIEIERFPNQVQVVVWTSKPGIVIGRKGATVKDLRSKLRDLTGKAVKLDGKSAACIVPTSDELDPSYKPLTIGGWFKSENGNGVLIAQGGESLGYSLYLEEGVLRFAIRQSGQLQQMHGPPIKSDDWNHVAAVLDADGRCWIHLNGRQPRESLKLGLIPGRPADSLSIGADTGSLVGPYDSSPPFAGLLEDVRLYWGVLNEASIKEWAER